MHLKITKTESNLSWHPRAAAKSPALPVTDLTTLGVTPGMDRSVMCDVVCYSVTCVMCCVVTQAVIYSRAALSQYRIMNHNERCEETSCYTIPKLLILSTFVDRIFIRFSKQSIMSMVGEIRRIVEKHKGQR